MPPYPMELREPNQSQLPCGAPSGPASQLLESKEFARDAASQLCRAGVQRFGARQRQGAGRPTSLHWQPRKYCMSTDFRCTLDESEPARTPESVL